MLVLFKRKKYSTWLASVIPVNKKNDQIYIYVNFRDLNKESPKDEFTSPIPELIMDIASLHAIFLFINDLFGYNQNKLVLEDEKNTTFKISMGIYCYIVMLFGLKNISATYQQTMI